MKVLPILSVEKDIVHSTDIDEFFEESAKIKACRIPFTKMKCFYKVSLLKSAIMFEKFV